MNWLKRLLLRWLLSSSYVTYQYVKDGDGEYVEIPTRHWFGVRG